MFHDWHIEHYAHTYAGFTEAGSPSCWYSILTLDKFCKLAEADSPHKYINIMAPTKSYYAAYKGVYLTLPPHIFSVQVRSPSILHHELVGASSKWNKKPNHNSNLNLNLLLPFFTFYNKICLYHDFSGIIIFTAYLLHEEEMLVRLYVTKNILIFDW